MVQRSKKDPFALLGETQLGLQLCLDACLHQAMQLPSTCRCRVAMAVAYPVSGAAVAVGAAAGAAGDRKPLHSPEKEG